MFNSDARQDEFVANLTTFKQNGTYVDIGSCHSQKSNNTYFFDRLGWRGLCVEINPSYNESYANRSKCAYLNADALTLDYSKEFELAGLPPVIDYLSLDIDDASLGVLRMIPFNRHRFRVITIEHDQYRTGDANRVPQRQILSSLGYRLLCADVHVEQPDFPDPECAFEDWWVHPDEFDPAILDKVASVSVPPSRIIEKFWRGGTVVDRLGLSWGQVEGSPFKDVLEQEFCGGRTPYDALFRVDPDDVVVDIGANIGMFSITAIDRGAARVIALEPHTGAHRTLTDNLSVMSATRPRTNAVAINMSVGCESGRTVSTTVFDPSSMNLGSAPVEVQSISFLDLVTNYGITHVDFLKLSCEGSEYDVLQGENLPYISRNVYKIAGEFHLHSQDLKDKFRRFRDEVLPLFPVHHVTSVDGVDIKWWLHEEAFIQNYHRVYFFLDNRSAISDQKKNPSTGG